MQKRFLFFIFIFFTFFLLLKTSESKPIELLFYGQVLIRESPYTDLEVTAHWFDLNGIYTKSTTKTLNIDEAYLKGNSDYAGYYFFDKGKIVTEENSKVVLTFGKYPYNLVLYANPKDPMFKVTTISFKYEGIGNLTETLSKNKEEEEETGISEETIKEILMREDIKTNITSENLFVDITNVSPLENLPENNSQIEEEFLLKKNNETENNNNNNIKNIKNMSNDIMWVFLLIISLLLLIVIFYVAVKYGSGYIGKVIYEIAKDPLSVKSKKILSLKIKNIVKQLEYVSFDSNYNDAATILANSDENIVFVLNKETYIGYISDEALLNYKGDRQKKIKDIDNVLIQKEVISIDSEESMENTYSAMKSYNANALVVYENNSLIGEINLSEMHNQISNLIKNIFDKKDASFPLVRDIMESSFILLDKEENIEKAKEEILKRKNEVIIVTEEGIPIGIFTRKDYLRNLMKYGENLSKNNIGALMSSPPVFIDPDITIFEANNLVIEKQFEIYPVKVHNNLIGIITKEKLFNELFNIIVSFSNK